MAIERLRIYAGINEVDYTDSVFKSTRDALVNNGNTSIISDSNVVANTSLDFKKNDGSTTVFTAKVKKIIRENEWKLTLLTNGWELQNKRIDKVYTSTSPEAIVEDVIDNFTNDLTFASTSTSGVTLDEYVAKGYLIDVIRDMIFILAWDFVINDANGNTYFDPPGTNNNGVVFTNGDNFQIVSWEEDVKSVINHIKVIGGFENILTQETVSGTGTTFALSFKPTGTFKATVSGSEVDPDDYTVNAEEQEIVFDSSKTDPTLDYSYDRPVIVEQQDDDSIASYDEVFKELQAPWLNSLSDARQYAKDFIKVFSVPRIFVKGFIPIIDFSYSPGETVQVVDSLRSEDESLIIHVLEYDAKEGVTNLSIGSRDFLIGDWQNEVQQRIKDIERRAVNETTNTEARTIKNDFKIDIELTSLTFEYRYPNNSMIAGHTSLSRVRGIDFEADCSLNYNEGTWQGTGLSGSQYTATGWKTGTYAGTFNGSDNYVPLGNDSSLDITGDFSIALAVKVTSLPGAETWILNKIDATDGYGVRIASDNKLELVYRNGGSETTFKATTALTANTFQHGTFVKNGTGLTFYKDGTSDNTGTGGSVVGTTTNNLEIGRQSTNYFTGVLDEVRIYDNNLTSANVTDLNNFLDVTTDLQCYITFDNNLVGDNQSARTTVT